MAIDMAKIKNRLSSLSNTNSKSQYLWKPEPGKKNVVRIVPYQYNEETPFIELYFNYNVNNKSYLSPSSFGRPDPFLELAQKLKSSGDKEDYRMGSKLQPKMRVYAPVLVRDQEDKGVRFWAFGKQVYEEILSIIADADYGDITDLKTGRDITVEFKTAEETKNNFPETLIRVKPNQSVVTEDKSIFAKLKEQKDIKELYPELSYKELSEILEKWLSGEKSEETTENTETSEETVSPSSKKDEPSEESEEKPAVKAKTISSGKLEDEFDKLFNE